MNYTQRIGLAAVCSVLIHLLFAAGIGAALLAPRPPAQWGATAPSEPIVLNLQPEPEPERERPRQLTDAPAPAETPPEDTDMIAEVDTRAADPEPAEDEDSVPGPQPEEISEFRELAAAPQPAVEPTPPAPQALPEPEPEPEPETTPAPEPEPAPKASPRPAPPPEPERLPLEPPAPELAEADPAAEDLLEPFEVAQAAPAMPPQPEAPERRSRGEARQTVLNQGIASYDALQDEIAPYLQEVKRRVERRWNEALLTRYRGHMPTRAVVDMAIAPDGSLVHVEIVGEPDDRIYAALCQDAIRRAGPFPPFPFEVPDLYRSRNLEIRWTFSFLR